MRCSVCGNEMLYYDKVKRFIREENGHKRMIFVKRYRCKQCNKTIRKNPGGVIFRKHYRKDIILGVLNGSITPEVIGYEDYPCEMTMNRWKQEFIFERNLSNGDCKKM